METTIRDVRRARGFTLYDLARRCVPATTPQTVGRLENGTRTVSIAWLKRLAIAMDVEPKDLIFSAEKPELRVVADLGPKGASPPRRGAIIVPPSVSEGQVAVLVVASLGNYRAGDELWCDVLKGEDYARALNRDVLVPRAGSRFLFGRLINLHEEKMHILPLDAGARQHVVSSPEWLAVTRKLVRNL